MKLFAMCVVAAAAIYIDVQLFDERLFSVYVVATVTWFGLCLVRMHLDHKIRLHRVTHDPPPPSPYRADPP